MTNNNGLVPRSNLVEVEKGIFLERLTARAYRRAKVAFLLAGKKLTLAGPGAGYRDMATQREMRLGSLGDKKLAAKWHLNSASVVPLALAGFSSHGWGTCGDFLINGSASPSEASLELLQKYGWIRQFGARDPNHFVHRGGLGTRPVTRAFCIKYGLFVQPAGNK